MFDFFYLERNGLVWNIADITNILMALPNLLGLLLLAGLVKKLKDEYFSGAKNI